jgi:hypothetical protein
MIKVKAALPEASAWLPSKIKALPEAWASDSRNNRSIGLSN